MAAPGRLRLCVCACVCVCLCPIPRGICVCVHRQCCLSPCPGACHKGLSKVAPSAAGGYGQFEAPGRR